MKSRLICFALLLLLPAARAEEKTGDREELRRPIKQVLDYLALLSKHTIIADAKIEKSLVDGRDLSDAPKLNWRALLESVCVRNKLRIDDSRIKDNIITIYKPARVSLAFRDADIREVIMAIAVQSGQSVVVDQEVQGMVTAVMSDIDWDRAMDAVVKAAGFVVVKERAALRIGR